LIREEFLIKLKYMQKLLPTKKGILPKAPSIKKMIGPSFILLGMGLGSGELILWPYLSSNFGLGIIWAAIFGITLQFFINMEIARYTLITGESVFVGFTRKFGKISNYLFLVATILPWIWPGIIASSAKIIANIFQTNFNYLEIILLSLIGIFYSFGKVVYQTQEKMQKIIIFIGIPFILILTIILSNPTHWKSLLLGLMGVGDGFFLIPQNIPYSIFLAALAYAGAGGTLNLAQSFYVKEKGWGMGKYSGRITSITNPEREKVKLEGRIFSPNKKNISRFKNWWRKTNLEHFIVFWLTGSFTILILSLLSFVTAYKSAGVDTGINFLFLEAERIGVKTTKILGKAFLTISALMLFGTQFAVYGSNSRICSENLILINKDRFKIEDSRKYFYIFLWIQILAGIIIFLTGFNEPLTLIVIGAILNAFSMFIYSGMLLLVNTRSLERSLAPSFVRRSIIFLAFIFYGAFSIFTIAQNLSKLI